MTTIASLIWVTMVTCSRELGKVLAIKLGYEPDCQDKERMTEMMKDYGKDDEEWRKEERRRPETDEERVYIGRERCSHSRRRLPN